MLYDFEEKNMDFGRAKPTSWKNKNVSTCQKVDHHS
jgi:hypothetical protein